MLASGCGIWASIWAVRNFQAQIRLRNIEIELRREERTRVETDLCDTCRLGSVPAVCPIPAEHRPKNCPLNETKG